MNTVNSSPAPAVNPGALGGKYLTVSLGGETYGIAVLQVREIIRGEKITPVPQVPDYVAGVINLRGRIIPIVDLRRRFGFPAVVGERTCIVVVQIELPGRPSVPMGLVVDGVEEVALIAAGDIEPTPDFGCAATLSCLLGVAKQKGDVKMLLNIDRVIAPEDAPALARATG